MKHTSRKHKLGMGASRLRTNHPMVGTWEQLDNPFHKTSVLYEINVVDGKPTVRAWDEPDSQILEVSRVKWDGEGLHFTTFFPPTRYKTRHILQFVGRARASHQVGRDHEVWTRRPKKKSSPSGT
jgi:hypothetical protein